MPRALTAVAAVTMLLAGCGPGWPSTPLEPPIVEEVFRDASARVRLTALDEGGFPDRIVEYHLVVDEIGGASTELLTGHAQVQSVRAHARAARLPTMALVVAFRDQLCVVERGRSRCAEVASAVDPAMMDALFWRAADRESDPAERVRAAITLAWIDRAAGLIATEPLGAPTGDDALDAELDGTRARLTGDLALVRTLRSELGLYSAFRLSGLARACVPALEADIRRARAGRSPSSVALVDASLAHCSLRAPPP